MTKFTRECFENMQPLNLQKDKIEYISIWNCSKLLNKSPEKSAEQCLYSDFDITYVFVYL